jgi:hypothetical protein
LQISIHTPQRFANETFADYKQRRLQSAARVREMRTGFRFLGYVFNVKQYVQIEASGGTHRYHRRRWDGGSHRQKKKERVLYNLRRQQEGNVK